MGTITLHYVCQVVTMSCLVCGLHLCGLTVLSVPATSLTLQSSFIRGSGTNDNDKVRNSNMSSLPSKRWRRNVLHPSSQERHRSDTLFPQEDA